MTNRLLLLIIFSLFSVSAMAAGAGYNTSIGDAARNVNQVLMGVSDILEAIIYIAGVAVLCSSAMKYRIHRQNPQQIPISTVITELVLGIVLLCLPTATKYANEHLFVEGDPIQVPGSGSEAVSEQDTAKKHIPRPVAPTPPR